MTTFNRSCAHCREAAKTLREMAWDVQHSRTIRADRLEALADLLEAPSEGLRRAPVTVHKGK